MSRLINRNDILELMKKHPEGLTTNQLLGVCTHRFSARLRELKEEGIEWEKIYDKSQGVWIYHLV